LSPSRSRSGGPAGSPPAVRSTKYIAGFENADTATPGTGAPHRRRDRTGRHPHLVLRPGDLPALPRARDRLPRGPADDPDQRQRAARYGRVPLRRNGVHRAFGLGVLTVDDAGIARILVFGGGPTWPPISASHQP
jgi:hypothetical protein